MTDNTEFGSGYAKAYDILYREKDYEGECKLIQEAIDRFSEVKVQSILDVGCGTGGHTLRLTDLGYSVVGIDRSAEMLSIAAQKAEEKHLTVKLVEGDLKQVRLEETFQASLLMFAVLGYQIENGDVTTALSNVRRHLTDGGLLLFDVWYGPAVLSIRPEERVKEIRSGEERTIRMVSSKLDVRAQVCSVHYRLLTTVGDRITSETEETHRMRFFFEKEIELFLDTTGFQLLSLTAFPTLDKIPNEETWNVFGVARAR